MSEKKVAQKLNTRFSYFYFCTCYFINKLLWSYPKPERLDIYNNNIYIYPRNYKINEQGDYVAYPPSSNNPKEYYPPINSSTLDIEKFL